MSHFPLQFFNFTMHLAFLFHTTEIIFFLPFFFACFVVRCMCSPDRHKECDKLSPPGRCHTWIPLPPFSSQDFEHTYMCPVCFSSQRVWDSNHSHVGYSHLNHHATAGPRSYFLTYSSRREAPNVSQQRLTYLEFLRGRALNCSFLYSWGLEQPE